MTLDLCLWWALPSAVTFAWIAGVMWATDEPWVEWTGYEKTVLSVLGIIWPLGAALCLGITVSCIFKSFNEEGPDEH